MKIDEYLDSIVGKYKTRLDKNSSVFKAEFFNVESVCALNETEKKWLTDNYANVQLVYVPIRDNGQKTDDSNVLKEKYLQIYNGLYISPKLFKFMNLYEMSARRDKFPTIV